MRRPNGMHRFLTCLLLAALVFPASAAESRPAALGVVVQATKAQLGVSSVSPGTSVFDGDQLTTATQGMLQLRAGSALVYLGGESGIKLRRTPGGAQGVLTAGTVIISTSQARSLDIAAGGATLRPAADGRTVAQVTFLEPKKLHVIARRGALEFSYHGESEVIPEGASYLVVLDPLQDIPAAQQAPVPARSAGRVRKNFLFIIFFSVGWATQWALHEVFESPNRP